MTMNDINPEYETNALLHPLKASTTASLSFNYYLKNIITHLIPFILIASLNFFISMYIIDVFIPVDMTSLPDFFSQNVSQTQVSAVYGSLLPNLIATLTIGNALLTIPMALSVAVVKNSFLREKKSYGQILSEILPMTPKLLIIGGLATALMFSGIIILGIGLIITYIACPVWFCLTTVLIVQREDKSFFSSLWISKEYISGHFWQVFVTLILIGIIQAVISIFISFLISATVNPASLTDVNAPTTPLEQYLIAVGNSFMMPLSAISIYFIALDMKWRKINMPKWSYKQTYQGQGQTFYGRDPNNPQQPPYGQQPQYGQPPAYYQQPTYNNPPLRGQQPPSNQPMINQPVMNPPPGGQLETKFCGYCGARALTVKDKFCIQCGKTFPEL